MLGTTDTDVVVGGGGVAGTLAAAALHQLGYRVLVIEPGLHDERRLAGEVFHPPGVRGLAELGLLESLMRGSPALIKGFSVSPGTAGGGCTYFPYDEVPAHSTCGLGIEHAVIRQRLLEGVSLLPGVTVARGKRIVAIDQSDPSRVTVGVANGKASQEIHCRMVVAADGAQSRTARSVGIGVRQRRISTMFGYRLITEHLSDPDYGHVVLGAAAPILLYPINAREARILFDIPHQSGRLPRSEDCAEAFAVLPSRLRHEVERAVAAQPRMSVLVQAVTPDRVVRDRVVLVGDAGGSCHPLTASGMTRCVSDALLLRDVLTDYPKDLARALLLYQRRRRWAQATRLTLADALHDAFCGATPEARVVQRGIVARCRANAAARAATMALLSTADGRPLALLREVVKVMAHGLVAHVGASRGTDHEQTPLYRVVGGLAAAMLRHVRQIWRSALTPSALSPGRVRPAPARLIASDRHAAAQTGSTAMRSDQASPDPPALEQRTDSSA